MARYNLKVSGTKGELTPKVHERRDLELYKFGMSKVRNWLVMKQGGFTRRTGLRYQSATKNNAETVIRTFVFQDLQSLMVEFSSGYIRFRTLDGPILSSGSPYEIASPLLIELDRIRTVHVNDVIYVFHPLYPPQKLSRLSNTNWTIEDLEFEDGPYFALNDRDITMTASAYPTVGGSVTMTLSAEPDLRGIDLNNSRDIGRHFRFQMDGRYWWGKISTASSNTSFVINDLKLVPTGEVEETYSANPANVTSQTFQFGVIFAGNYPRCAEFSDGRLLLGSFTWNASRGVAASSVNIPTRFSPADIDGTVTDDAGFFREITLGSSDPLFWMVAKGRVQIGTATAIYTIGSRDPDANMTPRNFYAQREDGSVGVEETEPADVGASTLMAGRAGRSLLDLVYDGSVSRLQAPDISVLSSHLFTDRIKRMVWQQTPDHTLWTVLDGKLIGTTFDKFEKITGYHYHEVENGYVEDLAVIQGERQDYVFAVVKRTIDGSEVRYIERLDPLFEEALDDPVDAFFLDCGGTYKGAATNVVTGIDWLEGETVSALVDGKPVSGLTITGGTLTLPEGITGETISVGYPIDNICETLPPPLETPQGSRMGLKTRVYALVVSVLETSFLEIWTRDDQKTQIRHRDPSLDMGAPLPLCTCSEEVTVDDSWDDSGRINWSVPTPTPGTVLAINSQVEIE